MVEGFKGVRFYKGRYMIVAYTDDDTLIGMWDTLTEFCDAAGKTMRTGNWDLWKMRTRPNSHIKLFGNLCRLYLIDMKGGE